MRHIVSVLQAEELNLKASASVMKADGKTQVV